MTALRKKTIRFNVEQHRYTDEDDEPYISSTQLLHTVKEEFNTRYWSMYRALDYAGYDPKPADIPNELISIKLRGTKMVFPLSSFYAGIIELPLSAEHFADKWNNISEVACEWGTNKHSYLEVCINKFSGTEGKGLNQITGEVKSYTNRTVDDPVEVRPYMFKVANLDELENSPLRVTYPKIYDLLRTLVERGYVIYTELRVYLPDAYIAGTIDLVAIHPSRQFVIVDWKTNRKKLMFDSGYYKKEWLPDRSDKYETDNWVSTMTTLKFPLQDIPESTGNLYTLQISLYAYILEQWGYTFQRAFLYHIRPLCDQYGRILYDEEGQRLEHEPEKYDLLYRKDAVGRLVNWYRDNRTLTKSNSHG